MPLGGEAAAGRQKEYRAAARREDEGGIRGASEKRGLSDRAEAGTAPRVSEVRNGLTTACGGVRLPVARWVAWRVEGMAVVEGGAGSLYTYHHTHHRFTVTYHCRPRRNDRAAGPPCRAAELPVAKELAAALAARQAARALQEENAADLTRALAHTAVPRWRASSPRRTAERPCAARPAAQSGSWNG